jgi:hypothetical protein
MKVTQPSSRSISILSDSGVEFLVPYVFFWNGHERPAESIALTAPARGSGARGAYEVRAFFLFAEIRDEIREDAGGITLRRTWLVKTPGAVRLSIDIELDPPDGFRTLFPGVHAAAGMPAAPLSFLGEKTSYPSGIVLALKGEGVLVFSPSAVCGGVGGGIGISRPENEDGSSRLRVQMRFPGIEEPAGRIGPRPQDVQEPVDATLESPGSLERTHEICLFYAPAGHVLLRGAEAVRGRLVSRPVKRTSARPTVDEGFLAEALHGALATHLLQKGGVVGMRETPGSQWLSSTAGLGCAIAMRRLFPGDARLRELSLRLADFSLKGQLPSGFFHESYHVESGRWRGVHGHGDRTHLSVGQSSRVAELLLTLAADLAREGRPYEKYFMAGLRFVEFFLDDKGKLAMPGGLHLPAERAPVAGSAASLGGLELFFPMAAVLERSGRDRYKKALDLLVKRFSLLPWDVFLPPGSREDRGPDAVGALTATRLFARMRAMGYKPVEPPVSSAKAAAVKAAESARLFTSLLVPWIRVHAEKDGSPAFSGCLVDSFTRQRLLFAGYETALRLLDLAALLPESRGLLKSLARLCLDSVMEAPLGTAFIQHTVWDAGGETAEARGRRGPIDSRRLASELLAALRLAEEFPRV